ncbi:MAG: hypothetical protein ACRD1V_09710 [Vicinamibacterales bacterium]
MTYRYTPEVLEALAEHGLRPQPDTAPARVREALSDLYRYEIRRLKQDLLHGRVPKAQYSSRVLALRKRYGLLSVPIGLWARPGP